MAYEASLVDLAPGLHRGIPPEVYHARHHGLVRSSALKLLARSPAHYRAWLDGAEETESDPLRLGTAVHCAVLEPERFERTYIAEPDFGPCRANADLGVTTEQGRENKKRRDAWRAEHAGVPLLTDLEARAIRGMVAAVLRHPIAGPIFDGGEQELTVRWRDRETGLDCASRADHHRAELSLGVDLKSCTDASHDAFRRSVASYGYHLQNAHYDAGFAAVGAPLAHFCFVVAEKTPPFAVAVYTLDQEALGRAYQTNRRLMRSLVDCLATNTWPAYAETIQTIDLPPWAA